jgi:hypothetical protein
MNENLIVYLSASIGRARASFLLPNAQYHPPLQANDFEKLIQLPLAIVILDGLYSLELEQQVANILEAGVKVYGASALGALLAAKLAPVGMRGVGEIYQHFVDHIYQDDKVLGFAVSTAKNAHRRLTEPLVNVYATMDHAVLGNALNISMSRVIVEAAESLSDENRTFENIFLESQKRGIDQHVLRAFSNWVSNGGYVDQQREDACVVLNRVAYDLKTEALVDKTLVEQGVFT